MGVIEKSIRKRSNQKLAAEVFTPTRLTFDEVVAAVQAFCEESNANVTRTIETNQANARTRLGKWTASLSDPKNSHYYVAPHPEVRQVLIGFGQRPEPILAGRGNTHNGVWAARLSYPAGGNTVGLALLKWVMNSDGKLRHRSFYESLLENVHAAISSEASEPEGESYSPGGDDPGALSGASAGAVPRVPDVIPDSWSADTAAGAMAGQAPTPVGPAQGTISAGPSQTLVEPLRTQAGSWITDVGHRFPFLTRHEITGLAGLRALLAVHTGYHSSSYLTGGPITTGQMYGTLTHSLLRANVIQHSGATIVTCGAPKPDLTFAHDWQLKYTVGDDGTAVIEVPHHRRGNNEVRGAELLANMRAALTDSLASGVHLHLGEGAPYTEDLVVPMPAGAPGYPDDDESPFRRDFLGGVPAAGCAPLDLPVTARGTVTDAMRRSYFRSWPGQGDDLCVASLAGGRAFDSGSVVLRRAGANDQLAIYLPPGLPPIELERSYRAALRCMERIALNLKATDPGLCNTIGEHVSQLAATTQKTWSAASGTRLKDRPPGLWTEHWNRSTATPMVPVAAGRWYPIGVLVVSPEQTDYPLRAAQAADWVSTFKRVKPMLTPAGRPTGKHTFTSRRCGLLNNAENKALPYLRFAASDVVWDHRFKGVGSSQAWFWEVNARRTGGPGGPDSSAPSGGLLLATGWSHADGVLGYGESLLTLFRAFADVVTATDPHARIHTLYLAT